MNTLDPTASREARLEAILGEYLRAREAGSAPDRTELLARHPDLATELREFLDDQSLFRGLASPLLGTPGPDLTPPPDDATATMAGGHAPIAPVAPAGRFGDYEIIEEMARGGMGVVYKARQVSLNRVVALKMVLG